MEPEKPFINGSVFLPPLIEFIVILVVDLKRFLKKWLNNLILNWIPAHLKPQLNVQ